MRRGVDRRLCVAPMMARTDRHFRYFLRLVSRRVMLYTEMIASGALLHGDAGRHLRFDPAEHPLGAQLGGGDPRQLGRCARLVEEYGYDEINLNAGCPSDRVRSGGFGACLMLQPRLAAECIKAMQDNCALPVTIKSRTGVDEQDSYRHLARFVETVAAAGCRAFIVHARKAWLSGLSPRQNREIPPLLFERVYRLERDFPELEIVINGGVQNLRECQEHLQKVDGVMAGRAVCRNPWLLADADQEIFGEDNLLREGVSSQEAEPPQKKAAVMRAYLQYMERQLHQGETLHAMSRHLVGLYQGQPGARAFRRHLSEHTHKRNSGVEVIEQAMAFIAS